MRFHQKAGGEVITGLPFSAFDIDSHNHGFLVIYDLEKLNAEGRIHAYQEECNGKRK